MNDKQFETKYKELKQLHELLVREYNILEPKAEYLITNMKKLSPSIVRVKLRKLREAQKILEKKHSYFNKEIDKLKDWLSKEKLQKLSFIDGQTRIQK